MTFTEWLLKVHGYKGSTKCNAILKKYSVAKIKQLQKDYTIYVNTKKKDLP